MPYPSNDGPDDSYSTVSEQLRAFIERIERLEVEKKEVADQIKEVYAELKGQGYETPVVRHIIARRKKDSGALEEFESILETYLAALGDV